MAADGKTPLAHGALHFGHTMAASSFRKICSRPPFGATEGDCGDRRTETGGEGTSMVESNASRQFWPHPSPSDPADSASFAVSLVPPEMLANEPRTGQRVMLRFSEKVGSEVGPAMVDVDEVLALFDRGVISVPVRAGSKWPDYKAMGLAFDHIADADRALSRLAFDSLAFWLSQNPPDREQLRRWFCGHRGNVGIVAGVNGLAVIDLDDADFHDRVVHEISRISTTFPIERTPHGFHLYLRCRQPQPCSSLYLGMRRIGHFSALGGFVTCSPSVLADGSSYGWLPGRSLLDCDPVEIESLKQLNLAPMHPLRRLYKRARSRAKSR